MGVGFGPARGRERGKIYLTEKFLCLKINQIKLPLTADEHDLRRAAGKALRLDENRIRTLRVTKKAVDSRKKTIFSLYTT